MGIFSHEKIGLPTLFCIFAASNLSLIVFVRPKILSGCIGLFFFLLSFACEAQLLSDTTNLNLIKKEIDCIYNMHFQDARQLCDKIKAAYPDHPVIHLIRAMITYWENYPMTKTGSGKSSFEADLRECVNISEKNSNPSNEAEFLLADLCARGFLLLYYSDNNMVMEVIPLASSSYKYLMQSFNFTSAFADFYYFTGVYNYYRDAYPKAYPVYKPIVMLFPSGDMQTGLRQLSTAAVNSVVLRAESLVLLSNIFVTFENNFPQGIIYSRNLFQRYPDNPDFLAIFLRNLLLLKSYDEAEELIESSYAESANKYFQAQRSIFRGIIAEKKNHNNKTAREFYKKGLLDISPFGEYGNEYAAYSYFGLSRISAADGNKNEAVIYKKEALRLAAFKKINFDY